jgi:hypothetical protein
MTDKAVNRTRRSSIVEALTDKMKEISHANGYATDLGGHVYSRMRFWDEISEFPCVCVVAGPETLVHQGGGHKDRYLDLTLRAYVNEEESIEALEKLLEDIEFIVDNNGRLAYLDSKGVSGHTRDIIITFIDTDQGALAPLGVGEMTLQVKY